jgi:hypothetical protein
MKINNWRERLLDWRQATFGVGPNANTEYHSRINGNDALVIALGDSWTFGDGIPPQSRHSLIYGGLVADRLAADWLNIGCCAWSNSYVLSHLDYLIEQLKSCDYNKIYVIITLTENGRDIDQAAHYQFSCQPSFDELGETVEFYQSLLDRLEQVWCDSIRNAVDQMDTRYTVVVGNNFVWHNRVAAELKDCVTLAKRNWIECLAQAQGLPDPVRTNLVTGWIFDSINENIHKEVQVTSKTAYNSWAVPLIEQATQVNAWLDSSAMNNKKSSKHPNGNGHEVWARYILTLLQPTKA